MMQFFLAMTSLLCVASAAAAALEDLVPSFTKLSNNLKEEEIQDQTEKVPEATTDVSKNITTILPEIRYVNSCTYPGTCASFIYGRNCQRCQTGFVKDPEDDTKCKYENKNAFLLSSEFLVIRLISLGVKNTSEVIQTKNEKYSLRRYIDYNFKTNTVFWYNDADKTIYNAPLSNANSNSEEKSINRDDSTFIKDIAVDWIYDHIYWIDTNKSAICVSNFNGTMRKVLVMYGVDGPRSIAVNPLSGWMYWTGSMAGSIERAGLDGSKRKVVIGSKLNRPQGLVLDFVEHRLYWTQGSSFRSIWSSNFDGSDRTLVFKTTEVDFTGGYYRPIGIFDEHFYFTKDWTSDEVYKVNKCNGTELEKVYSPRFGLWDIKVYHATLQPEGENFCSKRIDRCSHFCLPAPSSGSDGYVSTTTCACPDGLILASDQRSCVTQNIVDAN